MENKQTAIQWFANQLGITSGTMLEQAKEMEKQQIIDAFYQCGRDNFEHIKVINRSATEYYDDTYGSKGSDESKLSVASLTDEQLKQKINKGNFSFLNIETTSSQTEISDKEIEKGAFRYDENQVVSDYRNSSTYGDFIEGAKWYREQLKKKQ